VWEIGEEICQTEEKTNWVHRETQMQWTLIEEEERIKRVIIMRSLATWPETVRREIKQE